MLLFPFDSRFTNLSNIQCCYAYLIPIFSTSLPFLWHHFQLWLDFMQCFNVCQALLDFKCAQLRFSFPLLFRWSYHYWRSQTCCHSCLLSLTWGSWRSLPLFLYIPTRAVLVTVYFLVGLCTLLGDVGVSFTAHLLHLDWMEASFEALYVHSIEERAIGAPTTYPSATTMASSSTATALSAALNFWYPYPVSPAPLVLVFLRESKGFSNLVFHAVHSTNPISKLVILYLHIGQRDGQIILKLDPIDQSLYHILLYSLIFILRYCQKFCLQACIIFVKQEDVLVIVEKSLLLVQRDILVSYNDALFFRVGSFILMEQYHTSGPVIFVFFKLPYPILHRGPNVAVLDLVPYSAFIGVLTGTV